MGGCLKLFVVYGRQNNHLITFSDANFRCRAIEKEALKLFFAEIPLSKAAFLKHRHQKEEIHKDNTHFHELPGFLAMTSLDAMTWAYKTTKEKKNESATGSQISKFFCSLHERSLKLRTGHENSVKKAIFWQFLASQ